MTQLPTVITIATVIILTIWVFRKVNQLADNKISSDKSLNELRKKFVKYDLLQIGLLFLFAIILSVIYYQLFTLICNLRISLLSDTEITVKPFMAAWFLGALFTALLTATFLVVIVLRWYLKSDWMEYSNYTTLSSFNSSFGRSVVKIFALITSVMIIVFFDWFTAFRKNDILINDLFGLGIKTYRYTDIVDIRNIERLKAPNGNIVDDEHYVIVFSDGTKWNTRQSGFADYQMDTKIIDLIVKKTKRQITDLEFDLE